MPRRPRINIPGRFYHIMLRGNDKKRIFYSTEDFIRLSFLLQEGIERFKHRIHAFCFMPNHIHLVLQASDTPISKVVQNFSFRYSSYFNRTHDAVGHLFQGRFKAILIDEATYLMKLVRYVHSNPIRSGLVDSLENYPWSSHHTYLGDQKHRFFWITVEEVLSYFGKTYESARKNYLSFHFLDETEADKLFTQGNFQGTILGNKEFIEQVNHSYQKAHPLEKISLSQAIHHTCAHFSTTLEEVQAPGKSRRMSYIRAIIATIVSKHPEWSFVELGNILNRNSVTLSNLARRQALKLHDSTTNFPKDLKQTELILAQIDKWRV